MIVAVLVVPPAGDPAGLLADGRCGFLPPAVVSFHDGCWVQRYPSDVMALPLWWDGRQVPEGVDRALRCAGLRFEHPCTTVEAAIELADVVVSGIGTFSPGLGGRVVRLTKDASGRLVEVP